MRWQYLLDSNDLDYARKQATLSLIDTWWNEFRKKSESLASSLLQGKADIEETAAWVTENLHPIDERLMWDFERLNDHEVQLVITAEGHEELRALVATIIERAPPMKGWSFVSFRQPESSDMVEAACEARTQMPLPKDLRVTLMPSQWNQIDLCFYSTSFKGKNNPQDLAFAYISAEIAVGEEAMAHWLGLVQTVQVTSGIQSLFDFSRRSVLPEQSLALGELRTSFEASRNEILARLPNGPLLDILNPESSPCALFQSQPRSSSGQKLADTSQRIICRTMASNIFLATVNSIAFSSKCHSKFDEVFCYLKIERPASVEDAAAHRQKLEDAFDLALRTTGHGCVLGGAFAPAYDFIDLALTSVSDAITVLRQTAKDTCLPPSSWLLFNDACWKDEWVGLHAESKQPP